MSEEGLTEQKKAELRQFAQTIYEATLAVDAKMSKLKARQAAKASD